MQNKIIKIISLLFLSILSTIVFFTKIDLNINSVYIFNFSSKTILMAMSGIVLYYFYSLYYFKFKSKSKLFKLLAFLFSIFMVLGESYSKINSWNLVFGDYRVFIFAFLKINCYFFIFNEIINFAYIYITEKKIKKFNILNPNSKFSKLFENKTFLISTIVILISWLPYIISFYPAILSPDPSNQIKQFFGIETHYIDGVVLVDENVVITNHHPVFHTVLLGGSVKLGRILFASDNFGLFIYSAIQITILSLTLAYTIKYMKKIGISSNFRFITLLIYSLVPVFPFYSMSAVKDVIYSSLIILYTIKLFDAVKNKCENISNKDIVINSLLLLSIMLIRNNGMHLIILSFPFLIILYKQNRLKLSIIFIVPLLLYIGYSNVLLSYFKITEGSIREMLSVPFQQTARYVSHYENEITKEEKESIDKVLGYDSLKERYNPNLSDPVKNNYNKYATSEDLKEYFKVWFKGLKKHPGVYIEATINNTYGYFYPDAKKWYIYFKYDKRLIENNEFDYHYNNFKTGRNILSTLGLIFPYLPILGIMVSIGFNTWIIFTLTAFIIKLKKYNYLVYLLPALISILICIVSPANTYFRYTMPYIFSMPLLMALFINIKNEKEKEK